MRTLLSLLSFLLVVGATNAQNNRTESAILLLKIADSLLQEAPVTITSVASPNPFGDKHDYYSEGPYWWPNPEDPEGPYIRRDGERYPDRFIAHHKVLDNMRDAVTILTAAYRLSMDEKYALHVVKHLHAWFVHPETRMNPSLLYAQAIKGISSGRGIGIIDTVSLIAVARAIKILEEAGMLKDADVSGIKNWFSQYASWMTTHPYGIEERDNGNNHSNWWAAQIAMYGILTGRAELLDTARVQFKKQLSAQMDAKGAFPEELARTNPYGYTMYNLDALSTTAYLASSPTEDLWSYAGTHGSLKKAWSYMYPFIVEKSKWPYKRDITGFDRLPGQRIGLLLAGTALKKKDWLQTWENLALRPTASNITNNALYFRLLWL
jgi:hypothetical protein